MNRRAFLKGIFGILGLTALGLPLSKPKALLAAEPETIKVFNPIIEITEYPPLIVPEVVPDPRSFQWRRWVRVPFYSDDPDGPGFLREVRIDDDQGT